MTEIQIRGARTHNLKNIDLDIPRDKLVVITGLSGSGKSSLAFDTIFAEGQRRYVESLSAYARQFLSIMEKPDIDHIEGLSPAISIEQKTTSHNPRSTVGTVTEIYDYLRLLFARAGTPKCPEHDVALAAQTISQMVDHVIALPPETKLMLLAPIVQDRKGEHKELLEDLKRQGFIRARIDGKIIEIDEAPQLEKNFKHTIEVVVDRFKVREDLELRLAESFETTLNLTDGIARIAYMDEQANSSKEDIVFSSRFACPKCGYSLSELEPRLFSFNNPAGACGECDGLGHIQHIDPVLVVNNPSLSLPGGAVRGWDRRNAWYNGMLESLEKHFGFELDTPFNELTESIQQIILFGSGEEDIDFSYPSAKGAMKTKTHPFEGIIPNMQRRFKETESSAVRDEMTKYFTDRACPSCNGRRLNKGARHVFVSNQTLPDITHLSILECLNFFQSLELEGNKGEIAEKIVKEISSRLQFLVNVGLNYLSLDRSSDTLSGGEAQRIRLASQIGAGLVGVMYILDEPSIGLHQRDNDRLLSTLVHLRDLGNTVIVVEHDEDAILNADYVIDIGPGAGVHGGHVVAAGTPKEVMSNPASLTGQYLCGALEIKIPEKRIQHTGQVLKICGASSNNLKQVDVEIPLGLMTCVTGVSGSGKSTLINDTLYRLLAREINKSSLIPAKYISHEGLDQFDKVVDIDQAPIGRTPRSNPATYTGLFTPIRELFSGTQEARSRGYKPGRFSFNVKGGRCEACQGDGVIKVEMHFLPDIYVPCDVCKSKRYNRETLDIKYKGKSINEVLEMTIEDAVVFFKAVPVIHRKLQTLMDVGLSYITLGQRATTLSGGEAQRIKLARELSKRDTGNTIYILDEPTTGLHFHDVEQLLQVLIRLRDHGNTIIIIEHNLDIIKTADWIIDLGPEGGTGGGEIIAQGTPEDVCEIESSFTGHYLKPILEKNKKNRAVETK
ncbi:MAG: excinuclease ABC subunit UvrA [Gammaproteobacteria bacterium]|nr:excinuclease ABC subunit UvrA [Gammaproteobacteria bacterium]